MLNAVPLGDNCGLKVSELCLGTMNFGEPGRGHQGDWTLDYEQAKPIFTTAMDNGLFYFDCADVYGQGACERVVGKLLRDLFARDEYVLATKVAMPMGRSANQGGLSRKHILEGVDASLKRLKLDYVDHLVIHRHPHGVRSHGEVPVEETLEALHDVVKAGKVSLSRYFIHVGMAIGGDAVDGCREWVDALSVSMQNHYNLIYREEEREMNPYCEQAGIALTPWSPLARGMLAGSYRGNFEEGSTARSQGRDKIRTQSLYRGKADFDIVERVHDVAKKYGKKPAQIAVAWLLNKPEITSPIVGVSKVEQLEELIEAAELELTDENNTHLEELYLPVENLLSLGTS